MKNLVRQFPNQLLQALEIPVPTLPFNPSEIQNIVIAGLGGSGITGMILKKLFVNEWKIPVEIVSGYQLPAYVNTKTFLILASYSGQTEETLALLEQGLQKEAKLLLIASGGTLQKRAAEKKLDFILLPTGFPPRAAIAFPFVALWRIFIQQGFLEKINIEVKIKALSIFLKENQTEIQKKAAELTVFLKNRLPVIYVQEQNEALAIRFRQQLAENSKQLSWHHVVPEMNHNELVGFEGKTPEQMGVVLLYLGNENEREKIRFAFFEKILTEKKIPFFVLKNENKDEIFTFFYILLLLDEVSVLLAEQKNIDPTPVAIIQTLKNTLSSQK